jgi:D-sedoheptulose 7-phosphate isomerase
MSSHVSTDDDGATMRSGEAAAAFERRREPAEELVGHAAAIVDAAFAMAVRFARGGKLLTFGVGPASADAQHVAVEFVHPVIVGKRALPALSLTSDIATITGIAATSGLDEIFAHQIRKLAGSDDIALGICAGPGADSVRRGLIAATQAGLLTIALTSGAGDAGPVAAEHVLMARSADPCVVKELHVTIYHLLWELVHVFFEQPSVLRGGTARL